IPQESYSKRRNQESYSKRRNNVIKDHFAKPGQMDWEVLCSVKGVSSIFVFWNGSERNVAQIAKMEDHIFLQGDVGNRIDYSRGISPVGKDYIIRPYHALWWT